jgi:serine O-acetyltransferase
MTAAHDSAHPRQDAKGHQNETKRNRTASWRRAVGLLSNTIERAREDIQVVCAKDPAVTSWREVLLYPHIHALWLHRVAHVFYVRDRRVAARAFAFFGRFISGGIDIHPGARIGRRFFIDHGAGVVIGETVEIGDDVMLYHLVTLGSVGWWRDLRRPPGAKRHPTLGDGVVVGTGAAVLGPVEVDVDSRIGCNAVVLTSLPPSTHVPAGMVVSAQACERQSTDDQCKAVNVVVTVALSRCAIRRLPVTFSRGERTTDHDGAGSHHLCPTESER